MHQQKKKYLKRLNVAFKLEELVSVRCYKKVCLCTEQVGMGVGVGWNFDRWEEHECWYGDGSCCSCARCAVCGSALMLV